MCRVLIIDDKKFSGETIKMILEDAGEAQADYSMNYADARELVMQAIKTNKPYEVFLIDQHLGSGKDGIEVMQELRTLSPDSDAIIFTGVDDIETGLRAYEAGAFRYLSKPFENRELLFLLKSLKQWRKDQREHHWQKLFTSMMEEALRKNTFQDVSEIVVEHALRLGFSRAHLFWVPTQKDLNPNNLRIGIACAGKNCIPNFLGSSESARLYPLRQWFDLNQARQSQNVSFLESGKANKIRRQAAALGYQWPKSEMTFLPLRGSNRLLGELMLDHDQTEKILSKHELSLLNFFAQQAAIVLENVSLISREKRTVQETSIISQIGRQVTGRAAEETNLSDLLDEVHTQVGSLMDVSNFSVVLIDPESGELGIGLLYKNGIRQTNIHNSTSMEIERLLLDIDSGIFWPNDVKKHLRTNKVNINEDIPLSCIGVQLRVGKKVIGGIVAKNYEVEDKFTRRDHILLAAVASQISGAIQLIHVHEAERKDAERLNVLRRAMMEMLRIAQENEDNLWLTVLTIATANFGTGFNRALLFLENEEHTKLIGKAGIGTNDIEEARRDWENIVEVDYQLDDFLTELEAGKLHFTQFHNFVDKISLQLDEHDNAFTQTLEEGQFVLVEEDQTEKKLPAEVREKINLSTCAILPILSGNRAIGLVLVDNKHSGRPLSENMLTRLQTVLSYAGLVWETLRQQYKSESLLDANYQIMGEAGLHSLKKTLQNICETARTITEADWALVYPLKEGEEFLFDRENTAYAGQLTHSITIKEKPNPEGVSVHILQTGKLMVNEIQEENTKIGHKYISENDFIKAERVQAVLGIAIRDIQRDVLLGILYLDYRTPQRFSSTDEHRAKALASLAAVAISNARRFDEQRHRKRLEAAQTTAEAVGTELYLPQMFRQVLRRLYSFFKKTTLCILTYDEDEYALKFAPSTLEFYKIQNSEFKGQNTFPLSGKSLACRVARNALKIKKYEPLNIADVRQVKDYLPLNPQTLSELCVPLLNSKQELLGVFVLERSQLHGFDEDDVALVGTVARQLSMAMERAQHSERLAFQSTVAANYAWAAEIAHDVNREIGHIRNWAFLIKETSQEDSIHGDYADKIEESAAILSGGPWINPPKQNIPFDQVIKKSVEQVQIRKDITVEWDLQCEDQYVYANTLTFSRILKHLIRNASDGLRKITHDKKIIIRTRKLKNRLVELQVEDNGSGVSEEARPYIFQRQYSTKGQEGGVGLLIVRQMVEEMDGKIQLLSQKPGRGAVFSIKLPSSTDPYSLEESKEAE